MEECEKKKSELLYNGGWWFFRFLFHFIGRAKVSGLENIPAGGAVIAPNHISLADPQLVGCCMKRDLFFMAKIELFKVPIFGSLISRTNAFKVRRGQMDIEAFRTAQRLLENGRAVLVFPEGTRSKDGNFRKPFHGVGMLSCMAQSPIVPVRIMNSDKFPYKQIKVIFGKPIYPPKDFEKKTYKELSERVIEEIGKLEN